MTGSLPYLLSALAYGSFAAYLGSRLTRSPVPRPATPAPGEKIELRTRWQPAWGEQTIVAAIMALHAFSVASAVFRGGEVFLSVGAALSAIVLVTVVIHWLGNFFYNLRGLQLLVFPVAALFALAPALLGPSHPMSNTGMWLLTAHVVVALLAYGLLTIAAMHAMLLSALDRRLRSGSLPPVLAGLPPLLTMETMLFQIIIAGFVLLSATVLSGLLFSEELFGMPLTFTHKNVFTLVSWAIFAALLIGRFMFGWRGRIALRWTLWGFLALVLAYVGSKFVLEVLLGR
ncbi:MAG: cytochrome c biogenesis protein CcsA [Proteobacteria bacterium]|nr:cytochrome c biogenesis protein CcsA [Burkholderiales bacterium]